MRIFSSIMILITFLTGCVASSYTTVKLETPSRYSTESWLYTTDAEKKDVGIVFLHGKRGNPDSDHNASFITNMRGLGYQVIAPVMPWSEMRGYDGTRSQGMEIINAAINSMKAKKVVLVGHSMGGMAVLQYGAGTVSPKVVGLVSVAPGHDPNNAFKLRTATYFDTKKACEMLAAGKGKERSHFSDMNAGRTYSINATAEYYCTYYSTKEYPDSLRISRDIKTPLFIMSGKKDHLTHVYSHENIYGSLPKNNKNKYAEMSGTHLSVLYEYTDAISQWIQSL